MEDKLLEILSGKMKQKNAPLTEHDYQLQNDDDGFFEKFGTLLHQESREEEILVADHLLNLDCARTQATEKDGDDHDFAKTEQAPDKLLDTATEMNIEDLYEEILHVLLNDVGRNSDNISTEALMIFAQDAFRMPNSSHLRITAIASKRTPPDLRVNIEIIKAENLLPKDPNGLSDPFVTLYLGSRKSHRYNTSVKPGTLNPVWEEHFSLPLYENSLEEVLVIEVWDFDPAETLKEKFGKILDVKGVKGLRKLMKEIAITASSGKHDNELIGRTTICLKSIPLSGLHAWHHLENLNKTKSCGSILVNISTSAEKNKYVAIQEHMQLLRILLLYELETSHVANYWWNGTYCKEAEVMICQHARQSGLTAFECALSQWHSYSAIHKVHKLSFALFNTILDVLLPTLKGMHYNNFEHLNIVWIGAKRIFPSCFLVLQNLRSKNSGDKNVQKTLGEVLEIFSKLDSLEVPPDIDLFLPQDAYPWLNEESAKPNISNAIVAAIKYGTNNWLDKIADETKDANFSELPKEEQLRYFIRLIQIVRADLHRALEFFDRMFFCKVSIYFSAELYKIYDTKLYETIKDMVEEMCAQIKRLDIDDDYEGNLPDVSNTNMGTALFELYIALKEYLALGADFCRESDLKMHEYYKWFERGVAHWLDISLIKALKRIQKAVHLDRLALLDHNVKYSTGAVDTLTIFYQIKIFWQQLEWPDIEGAYSFLAKIIFDICRCCTFYAQEVSKRIEMISDGGSDLSVVTTEWCLAINNIEYIRQSLPPLIKEFGTDELIEKIRALRSPEEAERCNSTIETVIANSSDTQRNQIQELIELVVLKITPMIQHLLIDGAENALEDSSSFEKLMSFLDTSLKVLYETLNNTNFFRILDCIWNSIYIIMSDIVRSNIAKRKPPEFYQNLRKNLHLMISAFRVSDTAIGSTVVFNDIERVLELHSSETSELIHRYYFENSTRQSSSEKHSYGQLTIRAEFTETGLSLNILNARNLKCLDNNSHCDSFVKVSFLPANKFKGVATIKTKVQYKTSFPLYDETFNLSLTEDQRSFMNAIILFTVKDPDLFGLTNQYLSECCILLSELKDLEGQQVHLDLSRPRFSDSDTMRALESRQDKEAKNFIRKLKTNATTTKS